MNIRIVRVAISLGLGLAVLLAVLALAGSSRAAELVEEIPPTDADIRSSAAATVTVYAQTRWPEKGAVITDKGLLRISGIAWGEGMTPPYLVDDPILHVERQDSRLYCVGWTAVTSAEHYMLYEATRPDFGAQTSVMVAAPNTSLFINKNSSPDGTYYYRVQAARFGFTPSRFSNVESVVVPWNSGALNRRLVAGAVALTGSVPVTVQVRINTDDWQTAAVTAAGWGGLDWSYAWTLPEASESLYTIQARALDAAGQPGPADTITVTVRNRRYALYLPLILKRWPPVPYAPTLAPISKPDTSDSYTITWSYEGSIAVVTYTLQEATDAEFTMNVNYYYPGSNTWYFITGQAPGIYYYRVWGNNAYGAGDVSNVIVASVSPLIPPTATPTPGGDYYDDFDNPASGWLISSTQIFQLSYAGGYYRNYVPLDINWGGITFTRWYWPLSPAPVPKPSGRFCVETVAHYGYTDEWLEQSWYAVVFGATDPSSTLYYNKVFYAGVNWNGEWGIHRVDGMQFPGPGNDHLPELDRTHCLSCQNPPEWDNSRVVVPKYRGPNKLKVIVDGMRLEFYVNDQHMFTGYDPALPSMTRVGLIGGPWEVTPTEVFFHYFSLDVGCDGNSAKP